ncbi:MAG: hypothetical protein N5P05_002243 [Chroococcopsis gigantea SAG 12.99]|jgi:glycolate oxidase FAD binding subunit|nr:hypothetical protein [Chroococcopsis gigantea SAG 12.99]
MAQSILSHLRSSLGPSTKIIPWFEVEAGWQEKINRAIIKEGLPLCVIFPDSEISLARLVSICSQNRWSLLICGNGTKLNWGGLIDSPQIAVSVARLNKIIDHAAGDLTVTVEAGITIAHLQNCLQSSGQFLPLDCSYTQDATAGGVMATADAGSWRQRYGGVRDMILGFSFIRADGQIAKAGGRVVKNVAGYDMMKLFTGSYGTLGIISQITFRLYPLPSTSATVLITGDGKSIDKIARSIRQSGLTPTKADILSTAMVASCGYGEDVGLIIRWETIPASIEQQVNTVTTLAKELNCKVVEYTAGSEVSLWQKLQTLIDEASQNLDNLCKIGIEPSSLGSFIEELDTLGQKRGLAVINLASGIGKIRVDSVETTLKLRRTCESRSGFLTLLDTAKETKTVCEPWGYTGNSGGIMTTIKQKFDPYSIFNPSKFINKI